jgi:argininosuccinate lyase
MWSGRFESELDESANEFNASLRFDKRLAFYDIIGSIAHVQMLKKQGIIEEADADVLHSALAQLKEDYGDDDYTGDYEDIHMAVEEILTGRIGTAAKRIHTARSRNDQVSVDMRLFTRDAISTLKLGLSNLILSIKGVALDHLESVMCGYTHMQKAQPITLAHHLSAYIEMFRRDIGRLSDLKVRMNQNPLGAGALAASTFDIDRDFT